ncbi:MAG TPA: aminotransferase class I/II-fold pyridoxal phosphate-dependent enzyme [Actinomycetota bacterium]|nr:aminotransferase class I/II-fold pyridoxal phosphate-dependent enzyme [Actinomycetota bacterium]
MGYPLDPSPEQMREMGRTALEYAIDFLGRRVDARAAQPLGAPEVARAHRGSPPEVGGEFAPLLELIETIANNATDNAGPGFLAYIPGGGLFASSIADLLSTTIDRYVNLWSEAPVAAQIEDNVVRWLCDLFDFPTESRGVLTSGGSMANFSAIVTARADRLPENFLSGTLYVSEHVHASVTKAAMLAGFPVRHVRSIAADPSMRLDVEALGLAVAEDRAAGLAPFAVVGSAGTTNTGAIDPLEELADVAATEGLWFHVDAAYGGFFQLTSRGRERFRGIERADSITLDPHKGLFLPYGTGALVVREGQKLRDAHHVGTSAYLQDLAGDADIPNFAEYSAELSRDFRGLRVWFPLKLHGVSAFREALDEKLDLTEHLYEELKADPNLEVPWPPDLTVVPFRLRDRDDEANRALLGAINATGRVFLSSTLLEGRFTIRPCIVSHRTHIDRVDECIEIIRRAAAEIA